MYKQIVDITDGMPTTRGLGIVISIGTGVLRISFGASACSLFGWKIGELINGYSGSRWGWLMGAIAGTAVSPFLKFSVGEGLIWKAGKVIELTSEEPFTQEEVIDYVRLSFSKLLDNIIKLKSLFIIRYAFLVGFFGGALNGLIWMAIAYSPWADNSVLTPEAAANFMEFAPFQGSVVGMLLGPVLAFIFKEESP